MITEATSPVTNFDESTTMRSTKKMTQTSTPEEKITQTTESPMTTTDSQTTISSKVSHSRNVYTYILRNA